MPRPTMRWRHTTCPPAAKCRRRQRYQENIYIYRHAFAPPSYNVSALRYFPAEAAPPSPLSKSFWRARHIKRRRLPMRARWRRVDGAISARALLYHRRLASPRACQHGIHAHIYWANRASRAYYASRPIGHGRYRRLSLLKTFNTLLPARARVETLLCQLIIALIFQPSKRAIISNYAQPPLRGHDECDMAFSMI